MLQFLGLSLTHYLDIVTQPLLHTKMQQKTETPELLSKQIRLLFKHILSTFATILNRYSKCKT